MSKKGYSLLSGFLGVILLTVVDQFTKYLAFTRLRGQENWILIPGVFELEYVENRENPIMNMAFVEARANDLDICGERGIWGAFDRYELDALILPGVTAQGIPATAGNPIISIPCGISESGAPVGLNLVGRIMDDYELLKIAAACERVLPKRPIPKV